MCGGDAVCETIYENCLNRCRSGAPVAHDVWAAVAVSPSTLHSGSSHGQNSEAEAKQLALKNCASGASDCELVNWGNNLCFALATSQPESIYGQDYDADRARAQTKALARCRLAGGKNCVAQASPCASDDPRWPSPAVPAAPVVGVDPKTVGTWEFPLQGGRWVWEINRNGTYKFHSEVGDGVAPHAGWFASNSGRWTLAASNGYSDAGIDSFESLATWVVTGRLGTGAWHRAANTASK
jgi:hypothetical protein